VKRAACVLALAIGWCWLAQAETFCEEKPSNTETVVPAVVARANGRAIMGDVYTRFLRQLEMSRKAQGNPLGPHESETMREQILDQLIDMELLLQKADAMGIKAGPREIDVLIDQARTQEGGDEQMKEVMKSRGITLDDFRTDMERSLKIQQLLEREAVNLVTVDPTEVKAFYDSNPRAFQVPEQVRARHILVRLPDGASDALRARAKQAIQRASERIQKGESFDEVAKDVSMDAVTARNGGDLGYFPKGHMAPELDKVAFSLAPGKVSELVETKLGYHLIKVEDKRPARTVSLQEAESRIRDYLKGKKGQESARAYIEKLRASAKIEKVIF
jgi:peptidyl-prolyl cis-trans isomerase C